MNSKADRERRISTLIGTCIAPAMLEHAGIASAEGADMLLRSETYALLTDSRTGMWHLSPATLAEMLVSELSGDELDVPEEQS